MAGAMGVGALLGLALLGSAPEPTLAWEAPLACPDEQALIAATERHLGHPLDPDETEVAVHASVRARGAGYRLELQIQRGDAVEQHSIDGLHCMELSEIAAGLAAIAIDPLALGHEVDSIVVLHSQPRLVQRPRAQRGQAEQPVVQRPIAKPPPPASPPPERAPEAKPAPRPEPPPAEPPPDEPAPVAPATPAQAQPEREFGPLGITLDEDPPERDRPERAIVPPRALILASGAAAVGLFPNPSPGVRGGLGFERRSFRIELDAAGWFAGRFRNEGSGGDLRAAEFALHPCWVPRWRVVEVRTCAAGGLGWVRAQGIGVTDPQVLRHPWAWLAAELGLAVVLERRVALFLDLGAAVNLARPIFWTEAPDARYVMPLISGRSRLGVEIRLP